MISRIEVADVCSPEELRLLLVEMIPRLKRSASWLCRDTGFYPGDVLNETVLTLLALKRPVLRSSARGFIVMQLRFVFLKLLDKRRRASLNELKFAKDPNSWVPIAEGQLDDDGRFVGG